MPRAIPSVLASIFVALLMAPVAASAASGLPATVSMEPDAAGPGEAVRVTGLDFPGSEVVELRLATPSGERFLATVTSESGGYFSQVVTLPGDAATGSWQLVASTASGTSARHDFTAGPVAAADVPAEPVASAAGGNSPSDIVVMLVVAVLIAGVIGGAGFIYYQSRLAGTQPGMSTGADPIWSGKSKGGDPAETATDEPVWLKTTAGADPSES